MAGEILRTVVGSGVHGIAIAGTDDHDEMGVYVEPPGPGGALAAGGAPVPGIPERPAGPAARPRTARPGAEPAGVGGALRLRREVLLARVAAGPPGLGDRPRRAADAADARAGA